MFSLESKQTSNTSNATLTHLNYTQTQTKTCVPTGNSNNLKQFYLLKAKICNLEF